MEQLETDGPHEESEQMKDYINYYYYYLNPVINENAENVDVSAAAFKCEFIFIEWESLKQHTKKVIRFSYCDDLMSVKKT